MYLVLNLTNKIVYLSDIKAEIPANKSIDLENITSIDNIKKSLDLETALKSKRIALTHTAKVNKVTPTKIEDKDIKKIIKEVISEENDKHKNEIRNILKEELSNSEINIINKQNKQSEQFYTEVDEAKLAQISQASVNKMSGEMEVSDNKSNVKINIVNKKLDQLSDEL
jgi:hypothetical protein